MDAINNDDISRAVKGPTFPLSNSVQSTEIDFDDLITASMVDTTTSTNQQPSNDSGVAGAPDGTDVGKVEDSGIDRKSETDPITKDTHPFERKKPLEPADPTRNKKVVAVPPNNSRLSNPTIQSGKINQIAGLEPQPTTSNGETSILYSALSRSPVTEPVISIPETEPPPVVNVVLDVPPHPIVVEDTEPNVIVSVKRKTDNDTDTTTENINSVIKKHRKRIKMEELLARPLTPPPNRIVHARLSYNDRILEIIDLDRIVEVGTIKESEHVLFSMNESDKISYCHFFIFHSTYPPERYLQRKSEALKRLRDPKWRPPRIVDTEPRPGDFYLLCASRSGIFITEDVLKLRSRDPVILPIKCSIRFPNTQIRLQFESYCSPTPDSKRIFPTIDARDVETIIPRPQAFMQQQQQQQQPAPMTPVQPVPVVKVEQVPVPVVSPVKTTGGKRPVSNDLNVTTPPKLKEKKVKVKVEKTSPATPATPVSESPDKGNGFVKPPFSYSQLITQAILSAPDKQRNINDMFAWISEHYPYYQMGGRWMHGVRHNLSLHTWFERTDNGMRLDKGKRTKGCQWRVNPEHETELVEKMNKARQLNSKNNCTKYEQKIVPLDGPSEVKPEKVTDGHVVGDVVEPVLVPVTGTGETEPLTGLIDPCEQELMQHINLTTYEQQQGHVTTLANGNFSTFSDDVVDHVIENPNGPDSKQIIYAPLVATIHPHALAFNRTLDFEQYELTYPNGMIGSNYVMGAEGENEWSTH